MYFIFIDPSGSFNEGKGHTGISIIKNWDWSTLTVYSVAAKDFDKRIDYWNKILAFIKGTPNPKQVIIESFTIRANGFLLGKMPETIQLIGALVWHMDTEGIKYTFQSPTQAKTRFKDDLIGNYIPNFIRKPNGYYYLNDKRINDHVRDSLKHLLYYKKYHRDLYEED
jgi:hypothetical protein